MNKLFLGTHTSKLDEKNRISIPVSFRNIVQAQDQGLFAYESLMNNCIEVCPSSKIEEITSYIQSFPPFSEEREAISSALLGSSEHSNLDSKGRISISKRTLEFASLKKEVILIGKGDKFEIWDKDNFNAYYEESRQIAKKFLIGRGKS